MSAAAREHAAEVLVIGGGPAGLTAAAALARVHGRQVVLLDRESEAGGIPRHSDHPGYGLRDLRRVLSGPAYAQRLVADALSAGVDIRTSSMVTGWTPDGAAEVTSPRGRYAVRAEATVLATGARERPRAARLVPGDRPAGVFTTGQLQNLVHLHHGTPGRRAVVVGAELVSWSAVLTLREAGCRTIAMTTEHARAESYAAFTVAGRVALRTTVARRTRVVRIIGRPRVTAVEVADLDTGRRRLIDCDTVVFTGDWIPDNELARSAGLHLDPASKGPLVDAALRTSSPGVFAAGNLVHPVDTADVAALGGRQVADSVQTWLERAKCPAQWPPVEALPLTASAPLRWVSPGLYHPGGPAPTRDRLVLWSDAFVRFPQVVLTQDGRELGRIRTPWPASPGRAFHLPARLLRAADPGGGALHLSLGSMH